MNSDDAPPLPHNRANSTLAKHKCEDGDFMIIINVSFFRR